MRTLAEVLHACNTLPAHYVSQLRKEEYSSARCPGFHSVTQLRCTMPCHTLSTTQAHIVLRLQFVKRGRDGTCPNNKWCITPVPRKGQYVKIVRQAPGRPPLFSFYINIFIWHPFRNTIEIVVFISLYGQSWNHFGLVRSLENIYGLLWQYWYLYTK